MAAAGASPPAGVPSQLITKVVLSLTTTSAISATPAAIVEDGQLGYLSADDLHRWRQARRVFASPSTERLYLAWLADGDAVLEWPGSRTIRLRSAPDPDAAACLRTVWQHGGCRVTGATVPKGHRPARWPRELAIPSICERASVDNLVTGEGGATPPFRRRLDPAQGCAESSRFRSLPPRLCTNREGDSHMPFIKPRTNRVRIVRHICRLQEPNRNTLTQYASFIGDIPDYVLNQLIDSALGKDREVLAWRTEQGITAETSPAPAASRRVRRAWPGA